MDTMKVLLKKTLGISLFLQLTAAGLLSATAQRPAGLREEVPLATGWHFQMDVADLGEKEGWYGEGFDRSGWATVTVPKAWDLYDQALWGYEGIGWYTVSIKGILARPATVQWLRFARVNYHTRVWLNGELLGENIGGYLPFEFDVTGKLRATTPNTLVLRVTNKPKLEWLPAAKDIEWVQYGGLLGPVELVSAPDLHISDVSINAVPRGKGASITCKVTIRNSGERNQELALLVGVAGITGSWRSIPLDAGAGATSVHEVQLSVDRAKPWSPESPSLYTLAAAIESQGELLDRVVSRFGVRKIEVRGREILLNGRRLRAKGVNRYDEYGRHGPNAPKALIVEDVRLMKHTGVNCIRMHYPQSPDLLSLYDEMGFVVIEELPINWWGNNFSGRDGEVQNEDILKQAFPMLEQMIRRDKNHPAIVIWSMANESTTDTEVGIRVMRKLIKRAKELDRSRLVTFVTDRDAKAQKAYEDADLVAINVYQGQFSEKIAHNISQLEELVRKPTEDRIRQQLVSYPDKPLIVTEFGTRGVPTVHGDVHYTEEFQAAFIQAA